MKVEKVRSIARWLRREELTALLALAKEDAAILIAVLEAELDRKGQ